MYNFLMLLFPFKKIMLIFNTHSITNVWIYGHPLHTSVRFSSLDYLSKNKKKEKHMYYRFTSFVKYFLTYTTFKLHRDIKKPYCVIFSHFLPWLFIISNYIYNLFNIRHMGVTSWWFGSSNWGDIYLIVWNENMLVELSNPRNKFIFYFLRKQSKK